MSTTIPSMPRFLLPQLTWKSSLPKTTVRYYSPTRPSPLTRLSPNRHPPSHRTIASIAQPWYEHSRRTATSPCISPIRTSQARPSIPAIDNREPNPLRAAYRIFSQKPFSTTSYLFRDHHFDTLKLVQRLKDEGFSEEQSKSMMLVLSDVIEESIQNLTRTMVLHEGINLYLPSPSPLYVERTRQLTYAIIDADRSTYTQKVDFTKLRSELLALDSSDTSVTLASHDRLSNDIAKISSRLRDEIGRAQASVRLDLNLEKGRIREEAKGQELKIKETETRIEQEVAGLKERVDEVKSNSMQWLIGLCTGSGAMVLAAWRLLM